jgi:hypothetical protein
MNQWNERLSTDERNKLSFVEQISWSATKTEILTCERGDEVRSKSAEEIFCHKRETVVMSKLNKYYCAMKSQYNNISVLKLKQLSKTNQSECDVVCNHSMIDYCGSQLMTAMKCSPPRCPKTEKEDYRRKSEKISYCQWYLTLTDCVVSP